MSQLKMRGLFQQPGSARGMVGQIIYELPRFCYRQALNVSHDVLREEHSPVFREWTDTYQRMRSYRICRDRVRV